MSRSKGIRAAQRAESASDRFDRFWIPEPNSGCFLWFGNHHKKGGHGGFKKPGERRETLAHRFAYERAYGPVPAGLFVCHKCNVPACVNPAHLYAGTRSDNARDAVRIGRFKVFKPGEQHINSKLTESDVRRIRQMVSGGFRRADVAAMHGVCEANVSMITTRKTWAHVGDAT